MDDYTDWLVRYMGLSSVLTLTNWLVTAGHAIWRQ